jgi:hypothetical protein
LLGGLGWANSPRDGEGKPLVLTAERRAIVVYVDAASGWAARLADVAEQLDGSMPPSAVAEVDPDPALPTLPAPGAQPVDLYRRTHDAQAAYAALRDLALEVERTHVPQALVGLHEGLVLPAVAAHLAWAEGVLAWIGAPESLAAEDVWTMRDEAHVTLAALQEAVADRWR